MSTIQSEEELPYTQLGEYTLRRFLGSGGVARVYEAEHPTYGIVALKLLNRPEDGEWLRRFSLEGEALRRTQHRQAPGLLKLIEVGSIPDPTASSDSMEVPYIATERIYGSTLQGEMTRGMEYTRLCTLAEKIAEALGEAHAADVVHRDLKPSNVMIRKDGDQPILIDWGCAQMLKGDLAGVTKRLHMDVTGTELYMTPERMMQADPRYHAAEDVEPNHTEDFYALGMTVLLGIVPDMKLLLAKSKSEQYRLAGQTPALLRDSVLSEDFEGDAPEWFQALRLVQPHLNGMINVRQHCRYSTSRDVKMALRQMRLTLEVHQKEFDESKMHRLANAKRTLHLPWLRDLARRKPFDEWSLLAQIRHGPIALLTKEQCAQVEGRQEAPDKQDALLLPYGSLQLHDTVYVGRESDTYFCISDLTISKTHLRIDPFGTEYMIMDMHSKNGTHMNGERLRPGEGQIIPPCADLKVGSADLRFINWSDELYELLQKETPSRFKSRRAPKADSGTTKGLNIPSSNTPV